MKRIKKLFAALLAAACLLCACALPVSAEGLDNFRTPARTYRPGQFPDVALAGWYTPYVASVYEMGLMQGNSIGAFCPGGNITVAETLTLAARLHSLYHNGSAGFEQGTPWYRVYVDYARENGLTDEEFSDYTAPATRALFAAILSRTMPEEALPVINEVAEGQIPDVPADAGYASEVYRLYRAGVLTGNDAALTFAPDSFIRRSEVAAITARMTQPELRCALGGDRYPDLKEKSRAEDAFFSDAAMIGNSLVDGMMLYSGLPVSYYGGTGLTVFKNRLGELMQKQFGKVYIQFGINEIGGSMDQFISSYRGIIEKIHEAMPEAQIYIMAITPVTKAKNDAGTFTQKKISTFNDALYALAEETECWYLDTFNGMCDASGYLPNAYAGWDGSPHLEAAGYKAWAEIIRTHYAE